MSREPTKEGDHPTPGTTKGCHLKNRYEASDILPSSVKPSCFNWRKKV